MPGVGAGIRSNILLLTCDAFGVLPPVSRLTPEQAMYHFLSGYTAKVAGTERGLGTHPEAVFSACFGAPFMTLPPRLYADLLGEKMRRHKTGAWLINTGWIAGPCGVGHRVSLNYTRSMVDAILSGLLRDVPFARDPIFGLEYPTACPNVSPEILNPRDMWRDPADYDAAAHDLASRFHKNFERFPLADPAIKAAGPRV